MTPLIVISAAVFGASVAAFLPRVAHRLAVAAGDPPRTACPRCRSAYHGWVRAGPACGCAPWSLLVVPVGAAVGAATAVVIGATPMLPFLLVAGQVGVLLAVIDVRCLRLPDPLVAVLAVAGAGPAALLHPELAGRALAAGMTVLGAYGIMALLAGGGLGWGDVKLAAVLALILGFAGWPAVAIGLVAPYLINGPITVVLVLTRRSRVIAFGPALLIGALVGLTAA